MSKIKPEDLSGYLRLPETKEHPGMLIGMYRVPWISYAHQRLPFPPFADYLGCITLQEGMDFNRSTGHFTLSPLYFAEFLSSVLRGLRDRTQKIYDGNGARIDAMRLEILFHDITKLEKPLRGEWLAFHSYEKDDEIFARYTKFIKGNLIDIVERLDEDTLLGQQLISLEAWIKNPTSQGLPRKGIAEGFLSYCSPGTYAGAGFSVDHQEVCFSCNADPHLTHPTFGIRAARLVS